MSWTSEICFKIFKLSAVGWSLKVEQILVKWTSKLIQLVDHLWLENILLKKAGQAFEDFFTDVAKQHWGEDFEPWKPQGRLGDFKCDGYHVPTKTVFQCHGPEQANPVTTASKIQRDFNGAKMHFGRRMEKWIFVYNQRALPATSGKLLGDLRDRNPDIQIRNWLQVDVQRFALNLGSERLAILFPKLQAGHTVNELTRQALNEFVKSQTIPSNADTVVANSFGTNQISLDHAIQALADDDRAIRLRLLGYCKWFDPMTILQGMTLLANRGYAEALVFSNIERLNQEGLVKVTNLHILPHNERICTEAADSLADEFIEMLRDA